MKIAFLADPLSGFKIYKDSTFAMMREAARRGHTIHAFEQSDMALDGGVVSANVADITLTGDSHDWFRASVRRERRLSEFDAVRGELAAIVAPDALASLAEAIATLGFPSAAQQVKDIQNRKVVQ